MLNLILREQSETLGRAASEFHSNRRAGLAAPLCEKEVSAILEKKGGPRREEAQKARLPSPPSRRRKLPPCLSRPGIPGLEETAHSLADAWLPGLVVAPPQGKAGPPPPHLLLQRPQPGPPGSRRCRVCAAMETGPGAGGEKAASQGFVDTGEEKTGASDLPGQSALLPKCQGSPGGCFGGF